MEGSSLGLVTLSLVGTCIFNPDSYSLSTLLLMTSSAPLASLASIQTTAVRNGQRKGPKALGDTLQPAAPNLQNFSPQTRQLYMGVAKANKEQGSTHSVNRFLSPYFISKYCYWAQASVTQHTDKEFTTRESSSSKLACVSTFIYFFFNYNWQLCCTSVKHMHSI